MSDSYTEKLDSWTHLYYGGSKASLVVVECDLSFKNLDQKRRASVVVSRCRSCENFQIHSVPEEERVQRRGVDTKRNWLGWTDDVWRKQLSYPFLVIS